MRRRPAAVLLLTMIAGAVPVPAAPPATRKTWELGPFSWIKRAPAERGAPANEHPFRGEATALARSLGGVQVVSRDREEPLFDPAEAAALGKALAEAFAVAEPGQDLLLLSTARRRAGFFNDALSVTARLFIQGGQLQLIVQDARQNAVLLYNLEPRTPVFEHGSRTRPGPVVLKAEGAVSRRPDWLALPLDPSAARPTATLAPQPPSPPPPTTPTSLEDRLRSLRHLLEQGLISKEDYEAKKRELLKEL